MRLLLLISVFASGFLWASEAPHSVKAIDSSIKEYERKLLECEDTENNRGLPGPDLLNALRQYDEDNIRSFLIAKSSIALESCTMPELGKASFIIGAIQESRDVSSDVKAYARDKAVLLHASSWGFHQHYNDLHPEMKHELAQHEYFDGPFNALMILEELDIP